jgi:type I restriction enzyme S subunit
MKLKAGYKMTEVGVIPEDWEVKRIGDFALVGSGGTPRREVGSYWGGSIPWVTTSQIDFAVITEAKQFITEAGLKNSAAKLLPVGTLLLALYGQGKTRGKVGALGVPASTNQACASITLQKGISQEYMLHYLTSRYEIIRNSSNSGGQENLSGNIVKGIRVAFPQLQEQEEIAKTLNDVDALIAGLEKLIEKKRNIKQATMQQLLTGKTRLHGFTEAWEVKHLNELGIFLKGTGVRKDEANSGSLPCIRYGEIYTHHSEVVQKFNSWINKDVARSALPLKTGDLLFAASGETKEEIGKCTTYIGSDSPFAGGDIIVFRAMNIDPIFMSYVCNSKPVVVQKASLGQGDAVVHISAISLGRVSIQLPKFDEQKAIATLISGIDTELYSIEARLVKIRNIKQGVMQELLTGRTRLI